MKKLLHKLRMWLLDLLHADAQEARGSAFEDEIRDYKIVVREICRRSDNSYYDWCCEYCCVPCCEKRNGWCAAFAPKEFTKR